MERGSTRERWRTGSQPRSCECNPIWPERLLIEGLKVWPFIRLERTGDTKVPVVERMCHFLVYEIANLKARIRTCAVFPSIAIRPLLCRCISFLDRQVELLSSGGSPEILEGSFQIRPSLGFYNDSILEEIDQLAQVQFHTADSSFEDYIRRFIIIKLFSISHMLNYLQTITPPSERQPIMTLPKRLLTMNSKLRKFEKSRLRKIEVTDVFVLDSGNLAVQTVSVKDTQILLTFSSSWLDECFNLSAEILYPPMLVEITVLFEFRQSQPKAKRSPRKIPNVLGKSKIRTKYALSIDDIVKSVIEFEHPSDALKGVCEGWVWKGKRFDCKFYAGPRDDLVFSNVVGDDFATDFLWAHSDSDLTENESEPAEDDSKHPEEKIDAKHGGTDVKVVDWLKRGRRTPEEGQEVNQTYLLTPTKRARTNVRPENDGAGAHSHKSESRSLFKERDKMWIPSSAQPVKDESDCEDERIESGETDGGNGAGQSNQLDRGHSPETENDSCDGGFHDSDSDDVEIREQEGPHFSSSAGEQT